MAINFPNTPIVGDEYTYLDVTYKFTNSGGAGYWKAITIAPAVLSSNPNLLINGDFGVWQRGSSFPAIITNTFHTDRWHANNAFDTLDITRAELNQIDRDFTGSGSKNKLVNTITTTATDAAHCLIGQRVENVRESSGKTFALSFWVWSDVPRQIATEGHQLFGTGGGPSVRAIDSKIIDLPAGWYKVETTASFPDIGATVTGDGSYFMVLVWFSAAGSESVHTGLTQQPSGVIAMVDAKLELGSVATPFQSRPIGEELALCQRYFYRLAIGMACTSGSINATLAGGVMNFPVTMRRVPVFGADGAFRMQHSAAGAVFADLSTSTIIPYTDTSYISATNPAAAMTAGHAGVLEVTAGVLDFNAEL